MFMVSYCALIDMTDKKGIIEFGTTVFILLFVVVLVVIALLIYVTHLASQVSPSYQVVDKSSRQFFIADALSHLRLQDRQLIEHAIESSTAGSLAKSNSQFIDDSVAGFLGSYGMKYYSFSIKSGDKYISYADSIPNKCGANDEGICMDPVTYSVSDIQLNVQDKCGIGRMGIDAAGKCSDSEVCCQEHLDGSGNYLDSSGKRLAKCGSVGNRIGVCDYPQKHAFLKSTCYPGRIEIDKEDKECAGMICCAPFGDETLASTGSLYTADIPILFKGKALFDPGKYKCQNSDSTECSGQYVSGLCPAFGSNILCCVTDIIKCGAKNDKTCTESAICGDTSPDKGTCPGPSSFVCCSSPIASSPVIASTPSDFGPCDSTYYKTGDPVLGTMEVNVA